MQDLANNFAKVYQLDRRLEQRLVRLLTEQIAEINKADASGQHQQKQVTEEETEERGDYIDYGGHVDDHMAALNALDHSMSSNSSFDGSPAQHHPIHVN